jgi:mgtE-like transporter
VLAARLSTAFHLGTLSFSPTDDTLAGNAVATVGLALTVFPVVGAGAWVLTALTAGSNLAFPTVVVVATASGAVLAVLAVGVTIVATYAAYRFELDPDDLVIPVVTNVCDVLGVLVLFGVVQVVV